VIKLITPYIAYEDVETEFREIFESGWFTRGRFVEQFAQDLKAYTGAKHAFLMTSATTALWACMRLLDIGPGDEVVISDFSFPATANVAEDVGATPVFADVSPETYNSDAEEISRRITAKTKAVIFVDAFGNPTGLHAIKELCQERGIPLIEDAACAMGSAEHGVRCGAIADLTCFSFHPRKLLTTGEGGAITTNNDRWAEALAVKLAHGAKSKDGKLDFVEFGYNFRMSELQSVMGLKQLKMLDKITAERQGVAAEYARRLEPLGFARQAISQSASHNVQSVVYRVPTTVNRNALMGQLKSRGVETTLGTYCLSGTTYYRSKYASVRPNSKRLEDTTITLPCFAGVDVDMVTRAIQSALAQPSVKNS
jgi:perosamine synthetase